MTKMLMVGMPLADVIRASTSTPAKAIGYADKIGTLEVGREADIAVLEIRRTDFGMLGLLFSFSRVYLETLSSVQCKAQDQHGVA